MATLNATKLLLLTNQPKLTLTITLTLTDTVMLTSQTKLTLTVTVMVIFFTRILLTPIKRLFRINEGNIFAEAQRGVRGWAN